MPMSSTIGRRPSFFLSCRASSRWPTTRLTFNTYSRGGTAAPRNSAPAEQRADAAFRRIGDGLGQLRQHGQSEPHGRSAMAALRCPQTPILVLPVGRHSRFISCGRPVRSPKSTSASSGIVCNCLNDCCGEFEKPHSPHRALPLSRFNAHSQMHEMALCWSPSCAKD